MKYWYINQLDCIPEDGDLTDFVVIVHWSRMAKETIQDKEYFALLSDSQIFTKDSATDFIPYEDLTYDIICSWLDNSLNVSDLDMNLDYQIQDKYKPDVIVLPLPFENPIN